VIFSLAKTSQGNGTKFPLRSSCVRLLAILLAPSALYAQSCAMCYSTAANSGAQLIHALKEGILILLFPSLFIGTLMVVVAYRKRNQYAQD
jgi:hypothetical protein